MTIREALARWLAPDAFRTVERYKYLRSQLSDAQMWLGYEFPDVDAAIMWAKVSEVNHFRPLDAPSVAAVPGKPWIWSISDFREHLRAGRATPALGDCAGHGTAQRNHGSLSNGTPPNQDPTQ